REYFGLGEVAPPHPGKDRVGVCRQRRPVCLHGPVASPQPAEFESHTHPSSMYPHPFSLGALARGLPVVIERATPQASLCAPAEGVAVKTTRSAKSLSAQAGRIDEVHLSLFSTSVRTMTHPPKPPPVIRAPSAPAASAASTAMSTSGTVTS